MRIGITERGDAGLDLTWADKLSSVDSAILITKNLTPACINTLLACHAQGYPTICHVGITGWGGSVIEPCVPPIATQIAHIQQLLDGGYPAEQITIRIDPIIPTEEGLKRVASVVASVYNAFEHDIFDAFRFRVSVLDQYRYVAQRFIDLGLGPIYPSGAFQATPMMFQRVADVLSNLAIRYECTFETCAEPKLKGKGIAHTGCVSMRDLELMHLPTTDMPINPQKRFGCLCLAAKTELLTRKGQCPHKCAYCYWRS